MGMKLRGSYRWFPGRIWGPVLGWVWQASYRAEGTLCWRHWWGMSSRSVVTWLFGIDGPFTLENLGRMFGKSVCCARCLTPPVFERPATWLLPRTVDGGCLYTPCSVEGTFQRGYRFPWARAFIISFDSYRTGLKVYSPSSVREFKMNISLEPSL